MCVCLCVCVCVCVRVCVCVFLSVKCALMSWLNMNRGVGLCHAKQDSHVDVVRMYNLPRGICVHLSRCQELGLVQRKKGKTNHSNSSLSLSLSVCVSRSEVKSLT